MHDQQKSPDTERTVPISFSLPAREADALRKRARREDRSISSLVRLALRRASADATERESVAS